MGVAPNDWVLSNDWDVITEGGSVVAPHAEQNRASSGISLPHTGQNISSPSIYVDHGEPWTRTLHCELTAHKAEQVAQLMPAAFDVTFKLRF